MTLILPVRKSELGSPKLGQGALGTVYRTGYKIDHDSTELAYKEYANAAGTRHLIDSIGDAVKFRNGLTRDRREELDRYFLWPRETILDDATGEICGYLIPLLQPQFRWETGRLADQPRTLDWLVAPEQLLRINGVDLQDVIMADRLFLMEQLTFAVALLHKYGWVFGDISFKAAAFALRPPALTFFDVDGMTSSAQRHLAQHHSLNWVPPECMSDPGQIRQDAATDVYKLGLAITRCLKVELGATTTRNPARLRGILDAEGIELVERALSADRSERPSARELFLYLKQVTEPLMAPPHIHYATLAIQLVPHGLETQVNWQIEAAEDIAIFVGEDTSELVRAVRLADHPLGCTVPVPHSGQIRLEARSRYGTARLVVGDVTLLPPGAAAPAHSVNRSTRPPVFISYVRDDAHRIDRICEALAAAGIAYWHDMQSLLPGTRWRDEIRRAIRSGGAFLAFFSSNSEKRGRSYMREELRIAVEELRLRPRDRPWFIPIRLDECELPTIDLGGGESLSDLHFMDLFEAREQDGIRRLIATIERLDS